VRPGDVPPSIVDQMLAGNGDDQRVDDTRPLRRPAPRRPRLADQARHGLAGDFLADVESTTEAHPAGLLVSYLATFGCLVGPTPRLRLANVDHTARIWPVLVGETAKARKGTTQALVEAIAHDADADLRMRKLAGFGSGEILIDAVADDAETADRRLLWVEPEFARTLKVCARETNTLSPVLRDAWDGSALQSRARGKTSVATHSHISLIGHVVQAELLRYLSSSEIAGGFANRLMFHAVSRVRRLPGGGNLPTDIRAEHAERLAKALGNARRISRVSFGARGRLRWDELYEQMADDDPPGVLGAIVARPEGNVARLAMIYALLDGSSDIDVAHLDAAWAVWQHARVSAERIFGDLTGDPDLDRLLDRLEAAPDGLSATDIRDLFAGHGKGRRVTEDAMRRGLVVETVEQTSGRPRTVYRKAPEAPKAPDAR
jgi:hypothetical protein